eukprot:Gb_32950 [translate_table: standard]
MQAELLQRFPLHFARFPLEEDSLTVCAVEPPPTSSEKTCINRVLKDNADVRTNAICKGLDVQSLEHEQKSVHSKPLGKMLRNYWTVDRPGSKTNPEDREWRRLSDCLSNGSMECRGRHGAMIKEIVTAVEENEIENVERKIKIFNELQSIVQMLQNSNKNTREKAAMDTGSNAGSIQAYRLLVECRGAVTLDSKKPWSWKMFPQIPFAYKFKA